ncbi:MAG: amino acid adenylation domain-containing protein [Gemmatimonadota bacterium]|jgi:amino acid adenylation domain-containing protein
MGSRVYRTEAGTLPALLRPSFRRHADQVALESLDRQWSYRKLHQRAAWLARRLAAHGVGPEIRVGLFGRRRPELVAGMLGVLRAGGAFVPLDPAYPEERLRFMLEDSGARLVLCDHDQVHRIRGLGVQTLALDLGTASGPSGPPGSARPAGARHLAYVIYTSGSTGRPKGVAIEHRSAVAMVRWALAEMEPAELGCVLAATSICFDLSIFEIFAPLAAGGRIALADTVLDLPRLDGRSRVTLINTVPSAVSELLRQGGLPASVRTVNLAGEPVLRELVDRLFAAGAASVLNLYGPSEDTTYSTVARLERRSSRPPSIGRPIPGTEAFVLDREFRPVPDGTEGELGLTGEGLARGYLNRPGLTAESFVPDPLSGAPGSRLYRTGDLARRSASGTLDFLGRIDLQVKIRGFRVELGEVEEALARHPGVAEQAVVAVESPESRPRGGAATGPAPLAALVAFVVPRERNACSPASLRRHLESRLPGYMVPGLYRLVDELPRTPSGKLDRGALARGLGSFDFETGAVVQAPVGKAQEPVAESLRAIWAAVLGTGTVGLEDDLLAELGGHSLAAVRIAGRIREELGIAVDAADVLETRTVAKLDHRLRSRRVGAGPPISSARADAGPLRPVGTQAAFVRLDRLEPGQAALHVPVSLPLRARLDPAALDRSLIEVLARHEVLRWRFPAAAEGVVAEVAPVPATVLAVIDLASLPEAVRRAEGERVRRWVGETPFDLDRGPLHRFALALGDEGEEPRLHACFHHAVFDGGSIDVFRRELAAGYRARLAGGRARLPRLPVSFRDFVAWRRELGTGPAAREDRAYWRHLLRTAPSDHGLPTRRRRTAGRRVGGRCALRIEPATEEALRRLARREGTTLFVTLAAGLAALLHRYSAQTDLVLGASTAGRALPAFEGLIGCFLGTLPLRVHLEDRPRFRDLLQGVRDGLLDALRHQAVDFDDLARELQAERGAPLVRVMLTMLERPGADPSTDPWVGPPAVPPVPVAGTKLDLTLYGVEGPGRLELIAVYDVDRFEPVQMERLLVHLASLLTTAADTPGARIADLGLRPPGTVPAADAEPASLGAPEPIARCFDRLATAGADRIGVEGADGHWSYEALHRWSLTVAGRLLDRVDEAPGRVALLFEPGGAMVAALLGVLRAGKSYVPLDPRQPDGRLTAILEDAEIEAVLASRELLDRARSLAGRSPTVEMPEPAARAPTRRMRPVPPDAPAYLLYTSGSTGRPKAVVQSQDNVRYHARCYGERLNAGAGDRLTLLSTYAFDAAVMDIFGALLTGATLCPWDVLGAGLPELGRWIEARRITVYHSTPTLFRRLAAVLEEEGRVAGAALRWVVLGGEAVEVSDAEAFRRVFPRGCRWINGFGPTESTLALQEILHHDASPAPSVPIGRPVAGTGVRLSNEAGEQLAVYGTGEIVLRSRRLAQGYWRRPAATAAAFRPDPVGTGRRVYHTGDLGRLLPDGRIAYVGRRDLQVKIRGQRVEPGEIEAALLAEPGVEEAAVCRAVDARGRERLVAFLVARRSARLDPRILARRLSDTLPAYMVPSTWRVLDVMPSTPTGKIDRRGLVRFAAEAAEEEPPGPVERLPRPADSALATAWERLLGRPPRGTDDFFGAGGDSLTAIELAGELRKLGWALAPRQVLEHPLFADLAACARPCAPAATPVERPPASERLSLAPLQRYFFDQSPVPGRWTVAAAYDFASDVDAGLLARAVRVVVRRHDALGLRFLRQGRGWRQILGHAPVEGVLLTLDMDRIPVSHRSRVLRHAAATLQRRFDLARGPLVRFCLARPGAGQLPRLLVVAHHLVADELSLAVLRDDLERAYHDLSGGHAVALPPPTTPFTVWLRRAVDRAGSVEMESRRRRWAALPWHEAAKLPKDAPRGPNRRGAVDRVRLALDRKETEALLAGGRRRGVGPEELLLAALARALATWADSPSILVHKLWHGRDAAGVTGVDLSRTVGCLSSLIPVLVGLPDAATPEDALEAVRRSASRLPGGAPAVTLLGYAPEAVGHGPAAGSVPPPEVVLNYFGRRSDAPAGGPLRLRVADQDWGARHPPDQPRPYLLGVFAMIEHDAFQAHLEFSRGIHRRRTVERLARVIRRDLRDLSAPRPR